MFHYNVIVYNPPLDIDGAAPLSGTSGSPDQHHHLHQHHDSYKEVNPLFPEEAEQRWTGCWCPRVLLQLTEGWGFVKSAEDYQVQLNVHQGHLHRQVQRKSHLYPTSSPTCTCTVYSPGGGCTTLMQHHPDCHTAHICYLYGYMSVLCF